MYFDWLRPITRRSISTENINADGTSLVLYLKWNHNNEKRIFRIHKWRSVECESGPLSSGVSRLKILSQRNAVEWFIKGVPLFFNNCYFIELCNSPLLGVRSRKGCNYRCSSIQLSVSLDLLYWKALVRIINALDCPLWQKEKRTWTINGFIVFKWRIYIEVRMWRFSCSAFRIDQSCLDEIEQKTCTAVKTNS